MTNTKESRNKSKSRRRNTRDTKHDKIIHEKSNDTLNANDPTWYLRDPVMKQGLTRMPTFEFRGVDSQVTPLIAGNVTSAITPDVTLKSPTVACYFVNPSPGAAYYETDPVNMAARMLYSKLSSSNAKTSNYAPQDVATLMLALGEIISMISHYTRMYGITQYYNKMNRAIPSTLLMANGIDPERSATWVKELPEFRAELNQLITVANSISFPSNIPYFKKCSYIYQHVFIDNYSAMTGYHIMVPHHSWLVDETTYEEGTILSSYTVPPATDRNPTLGLLRSMINAVLTSTTYNYIYSDILNLATRGVLGSDLLSFGTIPIDYVVEPVLNDSFNWQIMNATIFGEPNATEYSGVLQNTRTPMNDVYPSANRNSLVYAPHWISSASSVSGWWTKCNVIEPIVRVPDINISEDDLLELLAYTGAQYNDINKPDTSSSLNIDSSISPIASSKASIPDHYITQVKVFYGEPDTTNAVTIKHNCIHFNNDSLIAAMAGEFEHFPLLYAFAGSETHEGQPRPNAPKFYGRLGAYTLDMAKAIRNVRKASYLGLFTTD